MIRVFKYNFFILIISSILSILLDNNYLYSFSIGLNTCFIIQILTYFSIYYLLNYKNYTIFIIRIILSYIIYCITMYTTFYYLSDIKYIITTFIGFLVFRIVMYIFK